MAALALALLGWRLWVMETVDTGLGGVASDAPISTVGPELDLTGLVVPVGGPGMTAAAEPVLPSFLEVAPSSSGGLRRAGPEDELLRNLARPFPGEAHFIYPIHQHGQAGLSLASDELR